jgi:6-pyruvoyl-tetrahydropterin synthase
VSRASLTQSDTQPQPQTTRSHQAEQPVRGGNGLVSAVASSPLSPIVEVAVTCVGIPSASGYLIDITEIDHACRELVAPILRESLFDELTRGEPADLYAVLRRAAHALRSTLSAPLASIEFRPSPYRRASFECAAASDHTQQRDTPMTGTFILSETFEFAAAHRLHLASRSDAENRQLFGKCTNPNGHGHNYRIEVAVETGTMSAADGDGQRLIDYAVIERVVDAEIMARFDHKHLNVDCPEFANLNPSVEHIAMVCHGILAPRFAEAGGRLRWVEVWETGKTSCRYPA